MPSVIARARLGFPASWWSFRHRIHKSSSVNGTKWHWLAAFEKVSIPDLQVQKRFRIYWRNGLVHPPQIAAPGGTRCQHLRHGSRGSSSSGWLGSTPAGSLCRGTRTIEPRAQRLSLGGVAHRRSFDRDAQGSGELPTHAPVLELRRLHEGAEGAEDCRFAARAIFGRFVQSSRAASMPCDNSLQPPQPPEQKGPARPAFGEPIPNQNTPVQPNTRSTKHASDSSKAKQDEGYAKYREIVQS